MTADPAALLASHIDHARQVVASTGSLNEAIGTLVLDLEEMGSGRAATIAALALIQLAGDEDYAGVTR